MQPVHKSGLNNGTLRRNSPLSLEPAVPAGMNKPVPGSTGASPMVPSRNGVAIMSLKYSRSKRPQPEAPSGSHIDADSETLRRVMGAGLASILVKAGWL